VQFSLPLNDAIARLVVFDLSGIWCQGVVRSGVCGGKVNAQALRSRLLGIIVATAFCVVICCGEAAFGDVTSLTVNPTSVFGTDTSHGTVNLDSIGVPRARTVDLSSSTPSIASVPTSVTTNFHSPNTAGFDITTYPVAVSTNVTITATEGGVSKQAVITVRPPTLTSLTFIPDSARGSDTSTATITINRPAASSWLCSIEGPFPPIYFASGSIVSFAQGATSTTKTINTQAVANPINTLITIRPPTGQSPTISNILEVVPTRVQSLTLTPQSVSGGAATLGCVTLNGAALSGGASVQLSSDDPSIASVPQNLQIAFGDNDGCFLVQSHSVTDCAAAVISASFGGVTEQLTLDVGIADQITDDMPNEHWGVRHSSTVDGKVLWDNGDDVSFFDGANTQLVQARGALEAINEDVFGLGTGANSGEVIAAWRRGTDFAWVWRSGGQPMLVNATNPFDPQQAMNPEVVAIADGSVFIVFQAFFNANSVKHVFRVDPITGIATNLTGNAAVPGVSRLTSDGGQAAWLFVDSSDPKLHFYDGTTIKLADSGPINGFNLRLARGRLVYEKMDEGASHVFLYDSTLDQPAPVRISEDTDAAHGNFSPITDGYHIAWLHGDADRTNLDVILYGGLQLNDATHRPVSPIGVEFPLQLQRGQLLWKDAQSNLLYSANGETIPICITPASSFSSPWLADGRIAGFGPVANSSDTGTEVFIYPGDVPHDAELPMPPILIEPTPGGESVVLQWDGILGASSYNVYLAEQSGVTRENYASLPGGQRISDIHIPSTKICELNNGSTYFFAVTATEEGIEGGISMETSATPSLQSAPDLAGARSAIQCFAGPAEFSPPKACPVLAFHLSDANCDAHVDLSDFAALSNELGAP